MDNSLYRYSPINYRPALTWPNAARVAFHVGLNFKAGGRPNWTWVAHGRTNSELHTDLSPTAERAALEEIVNTMSAATGGRPRGWMGPGLSETFETPRILSELGLKTAHYGAAS